MKLSKKLLAGLLATSMLATGSTAFATVKLDDGTKGTLAETEPSSGIYKGSGKMTMDAVGDAAKHAVTGTATFEDSVSVEITWGALTYSFVRTWNSTTGTWNDAEWETTAGSGKVSATNKSAKAYDVNLTFDHTAFGDDYQAARNYNNVTGKFYKNEVLDKDGVTGNTEQATLALGDKTSTDTRTQTSYLWLSGNPENAETLSVAGKYGFSAEGAAENSEVFGTVTATLANHTGV